MTKNITNLLLILVLFLGLTCCSEKSMQLRHLQQINSFMEDNPREAYDSLRYYRQLGLYDKPQKVAMYFRLLEAKAQNKLFLQMPSDSSFQAVVDYFEVKGNSNEKMEANYLLGCIYRDQREAPMAMQYYQKAIECADTLSNNCDYTILYSIYGQISDIYIKQDLYHEAMKTECMYSYYALKAGNKDDYILGQEKQALLYYSLKDTTKAISQINHCIQLYHQNGMAKNAADAYSLLIYIYVKKKCYSDAFRYMQIFEKESGLFDNHGNICKGREYYYNTKGQYFLGINQLDSAKIYFQKLDKSGYHFESNKGLLKLCERLKAWDQISKYALLCEKGMDSILDKKRINAVLQVSAMYDYQKLLEKSNADKLKKERAEKNTVLLILVIFSLCVLSIFLYSHYKVNLKNKQEEMKRKDDEHHQQMISLQAIQAVEASKKQKKINYLQNEIQEYKNEYKRMLSSEKNVVIEDNEVYKTFRKMASGQRTVPQPNERNWKDLEKMMGENFPVFYERIYSNRKGKKLSVLEWRVCLLTRLGLTNAEMVNLLSSSPSSISNAKQIANRKLFKEKGASTLLKNMLNI